MTVRDDGVPDGPWEFDGDVAAAFDDMLERSIPQYDVMRRAVTTLAVRVADRARTAGEIPLRFCDLGTSRGGALEPLVSRYGAHGRYLGIDVSDPMLTAARERFANWIDLGYVEIRNTDLREELPSGPWTVVLSILTLQFVPIEYRERIVADLYDQIRPGGALIVVEKVLGESRLDEAFVDAYYASKRDAGYSTEQIERKRLALEGVLVPITATWNDDLLRKAGFRPVDCFWRWMNFAGWVALRP